MDNEKKRKRNHEHYLKNKEHYLKLHWEWKEKNKESYRVYRDSYYLQNRVEILKEQSKRKKDNKLDWMWKLANLDMLDCKRCRYSTFFSTLDFHHVDPDRKEGCISQFIRQRITDDRINEIKKTIPLCSNCHRELHGGIWKLSELEVS